jgi:tetratricopeptide (TPR) repeat protein
MMKKIIIILSIICPLFFTSCGKFLEEYSQNAAYVESVNDLEELLYGGGFPAGTNASYLHLIADESRELVVNESGSFSQNNTYFFNKAGAHCWMVNPFYNYTGTASSGEEWDAFYKRISVLNSILLHVDQFKIDDQLSYVAGSSYFLRAWSYFMLVNIYGEPYDKKNPDLGAGIPLKSDPKIEDTKFSRNTTKEVYELIVSDLNKAASLLKSLPVQTLKTKVTANACYALQSRVYLYMEEYESAIESAEKLTNVQLFDLRQDYVTGSGISFLETENKEVIFVQGTPSILEVHAGTGQATNSSVNYVPRMSGTAYSVTPELGDLFDDNDCRYSAWFTRSYGVAELVCRKVRQPLPTNVVETDPVTGNSVFIVPTQGDPFSETASFRYAEVVLNKAEAQACIGNGNVVNTLTAFLTTRYKVPPIIPTQKDELIQFIRTERMKELCYEGHRWFDLRRYAVNTVLPYTKEIVHDHYQIVNNTASLLCKYTLKPYGEESKGSWIYPIPESVMDYCFPNITNFDRTTGVVQTNY